MVSLLDGCSEGCGWIAAIITVLSWGTFGVPLKVNTNVEVNFFVMQSYKTIVCFVTSWLVIFLGEEIRWTPWGIVSGMFWVPGAACGIYGIRNAGVAIAVGTWSAIQVTTSFIFGIIIFQESVKDFTQTMVAFGILMVGLVGMSVYSESPKPKGGGASGNGNGNGDYDAVATTDISTTSSVTHQRAPLQRKSSKGGNLGTVSPVLRETPSVDPSFDGIMDLALNISGSTSTTMIPMELDDASASLEHPLMMDDKTSSSRDRVVLFGGRLALTRRQMGILGAVVNGIWGGFNLIPLHYASRDQGMTGAAYLISYASGSLLVCLAIWAGLFGYHLVKRDYQWQDALEQLPAWHVRELGFPGMCAGIFYSIGNFGSILAVTYLGQGVGFSFCQGQLLISGLWGVFYFGEIQGKETITKWFASASVTVLGIIWLSYQHEGTPVHRLLLSLLFDEGYEKEEEYDLLISL